MTNAFQILVVGHGNDCRSALAERFLRHQFHELLGNASSAVRVSSAGVRAADGASMDPLAVKELWRLGGTRLGSRHAF